MTKAQRNLAIVFTVGFILLTAGIVFLPKDIGDSLKSPLMMIIGSWITNMTTIVNYNFGSSAGSKAKTLAIMGQMPEIKPND